MQRLIKGLSILLLLLVEKQQVVAQSCREIKIDDTPQKSSILDNYISNCKKRGFFYEDKGIIKLIIYTNAQGNTCWYLSALIDDRYRKVPPENYMFIRNDIIIIYKGFSPSRLQPIVGDVAARDTCIQNIVGGRVYECSTRKQFAYSTNAKGEIIKVPVIYSSGGNLHNDLIIIFNKDGTISKLIPV